jgi:hypothetical protein
MFRYTNSMLPYAQQYFHDTSTSDRHDASCTNVNFQYLPPCCSLSGDLADSNEEEDVLIPRSHIVLLWFRVIVMMRSSICAVRFLIFPPPSGFPVTELDSSLVGYACSYGLLPT